MQGWMTVQLGDYADFQEGYVNPPQGVAGYFDGPVNWLRAVDLQDGLVTETSRTLSNEGFMSAGKAAYLFPKGTLAISKSGTIGRVGLLNIDVAGNRAVINIRPYQDTLNTSFAFFALKLGRSQIETLADGSVQRNLYVSALSRFRFKLPPIKTQKAISGAMSALDDKIELNRRMNETLEASARALFRDWFVDFGPTRAKAKGRPAYLAPDLWSLFPDRLGDDGMPEGWALGTLGDIGRGVNLKVEPSAIDPDTPYIGLEHMPRRSIALADWEGAGKVTSAKSGFKAGQILFGKLRPYFHKVGLAPIDGICSTDIVVLEARHARDAALLLACVSSDDFVGFTNQGSTGTKMPRTSWPMMSRYSVAKPSPTIAECYQLIAGPMFERITANIHESRTLAATRDALLPKLMSGEIRVRDAEALAA